MDAPVVIIGTGLGGYNVAREFRKLDPATPLTLVTADDGRSYSKPMLSAAFDKGKDADSLAMAMPEDMAVQLNATVRTRTTVTGIDPARREVQIDGERFGYSRLVLAWGAQVLRAPLTGDGAEDVLSVNDLEDYAVFRQRLEGKRRVLIMGAGLIGCEFASDLTQAGFEVTIVAPDNHLLQLLVPGSAGRLLQKALEEKGVKVHLGPLVQAVHRDGDGYHVELNEDGPLAADLVVSAIGLRPRINLAEAAGLQVSRGIVTDQQLRTSDENIYALGDCAEVSGHSLQYILPLMASARALAKTLAGTPTPVHYPAMPVTVKTPACPVVALPPPRGLEGEWLIETARTDLRGEYRDEDGTLRGFVLCGERIKERFELAKKVPDLLPVPGQAPG